jgi:hypothetical protein
MADPSFPDSVRPVGGTPKTPALRRGERRRRRAPVEDDHPKKGHKDNAPDEEGRRGQNIDEHC